MSLETTLAERGDRYGDFTDHAAIAQRLQDEMRAAEGWARLSAVQKQALTVIADKVARVLSGDPDYADNWHDIQGYARLVEERLPKAKNFVFAATQGGADMANATFEQPAVNSHFSGNRIEARPPVPVPLASDPFPAAPIFTPPPAHMPAPIFTPPPAELTPNESPDYVDPHS